MPFQLVNDSTTEARAGSHTSATTKDVGIANMADETVRPVAHGPARGLRSSRRSRSRPARVCPVVGASGRDRRCSRPAAGSAAEDRHLLLLDALQERVDVVGRLEELLQRRDDHGGREVRPGVAVEELRDVLRLAHQLGRLLLQLGVRRGVASALAAMYGRPVLAAAAAASGLPRYFSNSLAPASLSGFADMQKPSIGASIAPEPMAESISGKVKKSRSSSSSGNCSLTKVPRM